MLHGTLSIRPLSKNYTVCSGIMQVTIATETPLLRTVLISSLWLTSLVVAYYFGTLSNGQDTAASTLAEQVARQTTSSSQTTTQAPGTARAGLAHSNGSSSDSPSDQDRLAALIENNRYFPAIELIQDMIDRKPSDMALRFQLAGLLQQTGQRRAAIAELLAIRSLSLESSDLIAARQHIDAISKAAHETFKSAGQTATASGFFEDLQILEPSHDRHRWYLAMWLITAGDLQGAQRLLDETGLSGITQAEKDQVQQLLTQTATTLDIHRKDGAMFADVVASTEHKVLQLNMVLDTGATLTAISLDKLRELGARRTPHIVTVQTANGTVKLPIYEVAQFEAGPLSLTNLQVVALTSPLPQADGLLGLDVLDQLPTPFTRDR